jgi:competence protein ComEA
MKTEKLKFLSKYYCNYLLFGFGLICLSFSLVFFLRVKISSARESGELLFAPTSEVVTALPAAPTVTIVVDIGGAVEKPGIYRLNELSRLADLISLAGGFRSPLVDKYYLQSQFNLAETLVDGHKYYVPYLDDPWIINRVTLPSVSETGTTTLISVNQASLKSLMTLPGIGEVRGQAIIDNRPYQSLEELVIKEVISQKIFDEIKSSLNL